MTSAYCAKDNSSCNKIADWVFSVVCWRCSKKQKDLLRSDWVGFESHGLWSSRIRAQGGHFGGSDCWSLPAFWNGCVMMCGQVSALFHSTFSCVVLHLITGMESRFRETGSVLTLTLQTKENADKKILFESRC